MALVDVRSRAWPLLFANYSFAREEGGGDVDDLTTSPGFWSLFEPAESGITVSSLISGDGLWGNPSCAWQRAEGGTDERAGERAARSAGPCISPSSSL